MDEKKLEEIDNENVDNDAAADYVPEITAYATAVRPWSASAEVYSWLDTLMHSLLAVIFIFLLFAKMSTVDGTSMLPTLEDQQRLVISDLFYKPAYNDIVVLWCDGLPNGSGGYGKAIVKRVVGLPGDKIYIDFANGYVYRNGELLEIEVRDGVLYEDGHIINTYTNEEEGRGNEFTVPADHLFVMGDNRNGSTDSRSEWVGDVDIRNVIGKAFWRVWPFDRFSGLY